MEAPLLHTATFFTSQLILRGTPNAKYWDRCIIYIFSFNLYNKNHDENNALIPDV